jgi:hypothetical protein
MNEHRLVTRIPLLLVVLVALLSIGCEDDMETTSIRDRIAQFESDLNNNRANAYTNLHPDVASLYTDPGDWDPPFDPTVTYSFTTVSPGSSSATATVSASEPADLIHDETATFQMKEDGDDNWKIIRLDITNFGNVVQ